MANHSKLSFGSYLSTSLSVTLQNYAPLVGFSFIIGLYFSAVAISYHFIDFEKNPLFLTGLMVAWFIMLPLLGGYLSFHEKVIQSKSISLGESLKIGFAKILPLVGALIGLLLIPSIIAMVGFVGAFFALENAQVPLGWSLLGLTTLLIILICNNRILSVLMIFFGEFDSAKALYHNKLIVKGHYAQTLFRSTFAFVFILVLFSSPLWLSFFTETDFTFSMLKVGIAAFDIIFIAPFFWSMMIVDFHDLHAQHQQTKSEPERQKAPVKDKIEPISKQKSMKDEDYF